VSARDERAVYEQMEADYRAVLEADYEAEMAAEWEREHFPLVWRWRTVRDPCRPFETAHAVWGKPRAIPHPLAHRVGHPVRELARGANGARLLEFTDGQRVVAPFYSVARA
jgi:hypothetical protein